MEKSEKFGFNLPSRDSDDVADINQISDNFRIIEETVPSKNDLKNIKTNVDQTYKPESENAQSGKAVAKALESIQFGEGGVVVVDQTFNPNSQNAQSGKAVAEAISGIQYFNIDNNGRISLKPEYRGATIDFASDSSILADLGATNCATLLSYAKSDNGVGNEGSKINELPEILYIPNSINGIEVKYLAPAMFAYNKRVKQIVLPTKKVQKTVDGEIVEVFEGVIGAIPAECFAYTINLEKVLNTENVKSIGYGSFFATRIEEIEFKSLTSIDDKSKKTFAKSGYLKKINIGNVTSIPIRAFSDCSCLEDIVHSSIITTVGGAAFYNTPSLKNIDFATTLTKIDEYAFKLSGVIFDWSTLKNCTFGTEATPLQMNGLDGNGNINIEWNNKIKETYTTRIKANRLNAPAVLFEQSNPRWATNKLNNYVPINHGCLFYSVMGAYCGIRGLKYDNPYDLMRINEEIPVPDGVIEKISSAEEMDKYTTHNFVAHDKGGFYANNYLKIVKYIGANGKYKTNNHYLLKAVADNEPYVWHDLEKETLTNLDLFVPNDFSITLKKWINGLGLTAVTDFMHPDKYPRIIEALQNGSYVVLNIPSSISKGNGHAILLYGVNANQEVLYVNTSVPSKVALKDYSGMVGSCLLQNITVATVQNSAKEPPFDKAGGIYHIIGEGTTKSLLNETVDDKIAEALEDIGGGGSGQDGVSPTVAVTKITNGHKVSITDVNGEKSFEVLDGAKGDKGETGNNGKDGTSVTITKITESDEDGGENVVTFSDGNTLTVKNGSKGSSGEGGTVDLSKKMDKFGDVSGNKVTVSDGFELKTSGGLSITSGEGGLRLTSQNSPLFLNANSIQVFGANGESAGKIANLAKPENPTDAANRQYVDDEITKVIGDINSVLATIVEGV